MDKLISNYHTHSYRCGHAEKCSDEEYVLAALKHGYTNLGFSDHAPFKDVHDPKLRMDFEPTFKEYVESINILKEKYKNKINIYLGLEIEYFADHDDYYKELLNFYHLDYLIVGQHLTYKDNVRVPYFKGDDDIQGFINYKNDLIKAMRTGYFKYVCHPDLFFNRVSNITPEIDKIIEEICFEAKNLNLPLEINLHGELNNKLLPKENGCLHYPSLYFFKKASAIGNKFVFGIDAHHLNEFDLINYDYFDTFLKEANINEKNLLSELKF